MTILPDEHKTAILRRLARLTAFDAEEAEFERLMLRSAARRVAAVTTDKLATTGPLATLVEASAYHSAAAWLGLLRARVVGTAAPEGDRR